MNNITNNNFKSPVIGHDSISGGTFAIEYAHLLWDYEYADEGLDLKVGKFYRAQGKIVITSENDNPLYKIAKESPLRLQGLIASVQFGIEKRLIKINSISQYIIEEDEIFGEIELNPVIFEILDGLEYLEGLVTYKEDHLC